MFAAAPKTYISRRMLDKYSEQRRQQQSAKSGAPVVPGKNFSEDAAKLAPVPEEKKEFEDTNQNVIKAQA